jgi:hypothetical protein
MRIPETAGESTIVYDLPSLWIKQKKTIHKNTIEFACSANYDLRQN